MKLLTSTPIGLTSLLAAGCLLAGCQKETPSAPGTTSGMSAREVLEKTIAAYRDAASYADAGELHFSAVKDGKEQVDDPRPFSVTFERPGKLRTHMFGGTIVSDGKQLHALADPIPSQALQVDAPKLLTDKNFATDEVLRYALTNDLPEIGAPQLDLLLADEPLAAELKSTTPPKLLDPKKIHDHLCYGVEMTRPDGSLVYWIDEKSFVVRRVDFPSAGLKKKLDPDNATSELHAWLDLPGAQLGEKIDPLAFEFEVPQGFTIVRKFVPPPGDDSEKSAYEKELAEATIDGGGKLVEVLRTPTAPQSEPTAFKRTERWKAADVKEPGNLLVVQRDGQSRIVVLDGWRTIVELDAAGKLLERHALPIPESAAVSFIRTAVDGEGKRYFVISSGRQQQAYLFDADWKLLLSYPEEEHLGIGDVQIGDVEGKGKLDLLIGFWGVAGVQRVSLGGERIWSNRTLENVLQIALSGPDAEGHRTVDAVSTRGTITPIDFRGKQEGDIRIAGRALTALVIDDVDGDGKYEGCGLAAVPGNDTALVAVGFDAGGSQVWTYELPPGYHETPIERIVPARLPGEGGWMLPAADGSIHLLTTSGQLVEKFNYGAVLSAVAMATIDSQTTLLVSAPGGVTAWSIEPVDTRPAAEN